MTTDCNSLGECCIVLRLNCKFKHQKNAACCPWRNFFTNSMSQNSAQVAWYGAINFSSCLMRSKSLWNSVDRSLAFSVPAFFSKVFTEEITWAKEADWEFFLIYVKNAFLKLKQWIEQSKSELHYINSVAKQKYYKFSDFCHSVGGRTILTNVEWIRFRNCGWNAVRINMCRVNGSKTILWIDLGFIRKIVRVYE